MIGPVDGFAAFAFGTAEADRWCDPVNVSEFDMPAATARVAEPVDVWAALLDNWLKLIRPTRRTHSELTIE
ncbi:MAG: hypothetical protein ACLPVY_00310 [Acidimicrobiia bacterium]